MAAFASRGISLANKCQLLFGLAVLLILGAALSVPWFRMRIMVDNGQFEVADQLADALIAGALVPGGVEGDALERLRAIDDHLPAANLDTTSSATGPARQPPDRPAPIVPPVSTSDDDPASAATMPHRAATADPPPRPLDGLTRPPAGELDGGNRLRVLWISVPDDATEFAERDPFIARSLALFADDPDRRTVFRAERREGQPFRYRYARAVRLRDLAANPAAWDDLTLRARRGADAAVGGLAIGPRAVARIRDLTVPRDLTDFAPWTWQPGELFRPDRDPDPDSGPDMASGGEVEAAPPAPLAVRPDRLIERADDGRAAGDGVSGSDRPLERLADPALAELVGVLLIDHSAESARAQIIINRTYLVFAGLLAIGLAVFVFYIITTRLILSPVRILRETAERVSQGNLYIRCDISTGDEFEELSDAFNHMLANWKDSQDQLRQMNKSLDLKLNELAESNTLLVEANRLKSEFLANVSHELRTPLNSILGFAEVILEMETEAAANSDAAEGSASGGGNGTAGAALTPADSKARDRRARYASNIMRSGKSLLELINDLLDLAKIEAGRMEVTPEPTSVADVCEGLATLIRPQAVKKRIAVEVKVSSTMPLIHTDPGKFQQILFNFLSNAVKFTPVGGSVTIAADRQRRRDHGEVVRVSVTDTGPGISKRDQSLIFEKFHQVDGGHNRQAEGTGLGLAICRELSQLLGGWIEVESEPDQGSTFTLYLPPRLIAERPQSLMGAM